MNVYDLAKPAMHIITAWEALGLVLCVLAAVFFGVLVIRQHIRNRNNREFTAAMRRALNK